jgi:hypothetical protein
MLPPGLATQEVNPPSEPYLGDQPKPGELLPAIRFRLEEGLYAGLPAGRTYQEQQAQSTYIEDSELEEPICELNEALRPKGEVGRLFGPHEALTGRDAAWAARISYLDANGHIDTWNEDLNQPTGRLEERLRLMQLIPAPVRESLPLPAETVVQAVERQVMVAEAAIAQRQGITDPSDREAVQNAARLMDERKAAWQKNRNDPDEAGSALAELLDGAIGKTAVMEGIPISNDPEAREATAKANREREAKLEREVAELTSIGNTVMEQMTKVSTGQPSDLSAVKAEINAVAAGNNPSDAVKAKLRLLRQGMDKAEVRRETDKLREAWQEHEAFINEHALEVAPTALSASLRERLRIHRNLQVDAFNGYEDPQLIARKIEALRWWQADKKKHVEALSHWRPLLVLSSNQTPYVWGTAGECIILADDRQIVTASLGRLLGVVDVM